MKAYYKGNVLGVLVSIPLIYLMMAVATVVGLLALISVLIIFVTFIGYLLVDGVRALWKRYIH